jgi:hypothetical protein
MKSLAVATPYPSMVPNFPGLDKDMATILVWPFTVLLDDSPSSQVFEITGTGDFCTFLP